MQDVGLLELAAKLTRLNGTYLGAWFAGVCQATLVNEVGELRVPSEQELRKSSSENDR